MKSNSWLTIYVDAGNTKIKFYTLISGRWKLVLDWPTRNLLSSLELLSKLQLGISAHTITFLICSVVPIWQQTFSNLKFHSTWCRVQIRWLTAAEIPLNLKFASHLNPQRIGSDLLALSCFAQQWSNTIVVSLGTAMTGLVLCDGIIQGYFIGSGLTLNYQTLTTKAQLIPTDILSGSRSNPQPLGINTATAVTVGSILVPWWGIMHWTNQIRQQTPRRWKLILTGGDVSLIKRLVRVDDWELEPYAVVIGMHRWFKFGSNK